jgi:predicted nucleotidyltransferase
MIPPLHPDADALIEEIHGGLRAALGKDLVGLCLFGSIATGHFEPDLSDVDLLAVLATDLDNVRFEQCNALHARLVRHHPKVGGTD